MSRSSEKAVDGSAAKAGIDEVRDTLQAERYMSENRKVIVNYLYGDTGTGKTRSIFC